VRSTPSAGTDRLILDNTRFVVSVARRYAGFGVPMEDLIAAGNLGLVEAAKRYDPTRENGFLTYAGFWIRKAILRAVQDDARMIRLPRYRWEQQRTIDNARRSLKAETGEAPAETDLVEATGLHPLRVRRSLQADFTIVSLDAPPGSQERAWKDLLANPGASDPASVAQHANSLARLRLLLAEFNERERRILALRYGLDGGPPMALREVAERVGLSRERVRQIESGCLDALRRQMSH
jgi:RNA polymerase primary sigma factor